jgi:hypothetical protein
MRIDFDIMKPSITRVGWRHLEGLLLGAPRLAGCVHYEFNSPIWPCGEEKKGPSFVGRRGRSTPRFPT